MVSRDGATGTVQMVVALLGAVEMIFAHAVCVEMRVDNETGCS